MALLIAICGSLLWPGGPASAAIGGDLERIEEWLASPNLDRRAAALRELDERVGLEEIEELDAYLARPLAESARRPLLDHLRHLTHAQLLEVEKAITAFESARRLTQQLTEQVAMRERDPDPPSPEDGVEPLEELREELEGRRRTRRQARERVREGHTRLREIGLTLAPVLFHRREAGGVDSPLVDRFHDRLWEELVGEATRLFPHAPARTSLSPHQSRALVPLTDALRPLDPNGWDRRARTVFEDAITQIESLDPDQVDEGRALLLEGGTQVALLLESWAGKSSPLPAALRRNVVTWNTLRLPPGFERRTALPLGEYPSLRRTDRLDVIHRLEFVDRESSPAVLDGIVRAEDDVALKVEAAAVLARLGDPRGADFLRQLGLERAVELEAISRRVLLIEALGLRAEGDEEGALEALLAILRRFGGDFRLHYEIAFTALRLRRFELSIEHFELAIELDPRDPVTHYNFACALSLAGKIERALVELEISIDGGFRDLGHILADEDLIPLRDHPKFRELTDALREE